MTSTIRFHAICRRALIAGMLPIAMVACMGDKIATVTTPNIATLYWSLHNNIRAVTVAVGGHQQLSLTPQTVSGAPIANAPTPAFLSGDSTKVTVDAHGLVTGVAETQGVPVIASLTLDQITYVDTTIVAVTPTSAVLQSVQLAIPPGGAILGVGGPPAVLDAVALDDHGAPIPGVAISITTSDSNKVMLFSYGGPTMVQPVLLGQVLIIATTTSYGITKADTVQFTVQYGTQGQVVAQSNSPCPGCPNRATLSPDAIAIGVGGTVTFSNYTSAPMDIAFDNNIANVVGGNIPNIDVFDQQSRQFIAAGTYKYHSTLLNVTGAIIVHDQPTY